jgi:hypothetical protein|tara:strand:+ start:238 stop:603 length:366 start_codon:yes stop_codon:yes gene_type:complete
MAHFAELDENNVVLRVLSVANSDIQDESGDEQESLGISFLQNLFGENTVWKQTSYNETIRKNYAAIGATYDASRDAFIPSKPFPSWILNEDTCHWNAPVPYPDFDKHYRWDEDTTSWVEIN